MGAPLDLRHVILPWARPELPPAEPDAGAEVDRLERDARDLRVSRDRLAIRTPGKRANTEEGAAMSAGPLPTLLSHGLPFRPHPSLPDDDRCLLEPAALLSAAVALDILGTRARPIPPSATVLADFTRELLAVGELGGIDAPAVQRLLAHAGSEVGGNRAALSRHLARTMAQPPRPADSAAEATAVGAAAASTPRAVHRAIARVLRATDVAIHEARLRLEEEAAQTAHRM